MKNFVKNDQGFTCFKCEKEVPPRENSSRDHCDNCLFGLHVDINPGDRMNDCKGVLHPVGLKTANGKTQIVYKCQKCGKTVFCIAAEDDNSDELAKLSGKVWKN